MRKSVSSPQNNWFDAENVDDDDLSLEQDHNNQLNSSLIDNHLGSGVIPEVLSQHILFDSDEAEGLLDGKYIQIQTQPSDNKKGNQLEVQLTNSLANGKKTVKIIIIGLDFENNLQYDTLSFSRNENQITSKHYINILGIFFNDFVGAPLQSFNLGGRLVIKEVSPISISRDPLMISQDREPNIIFRDFFVSTGGSLLNLLRTSFPTYNIDNLDINLSYKQLRSLDEDDVSSQIGQKFLSTTNNIQKITLLLSVINNDDPDNLIWTGDLLVSIFELQSTVSCSTDIVPNLAIEFDPFNIPLAQISVDYNALFDRGIILDTVPQPVDFIFSNTGIGSGILIKPNHYYLVSLKRAGSPDVCKIQIAVATNSLVEKTRETLFNGNIWTDVPEESVWFQAWSDAIKVSDGQAYDNGQGIQITKTATDLETGLTIDYSFDNKYFVRNDLYHALLTANLEESEPVQDERTGNPINSQKQFIPALTLLNATDLSNIEDTANPLIIGTVSDKNVKSANPATNIFESKFYSYGFVNNSIVLKVITDTSDGYRYDTDIIELVSELVNGNINNGKIIPDIASPSEYYRISKAELITLMYGDINGDGIIDINDLLLAQKLLNDDLNVFPDYNQYIVQTTLFQNDISLSWELVDPSGPTVITSGTDGILVANVIDGSLANFQSASTNFSSISNLDTYKLKILTSTTSIGNNSSFTITDLVDNNNITIQKQFYTSDTFLQILAGDIDGDMKLTTSDYSLIENYINLVAPIPATTSPANKIGTTFNAIRLTLEKYVDRADNYPANDSDRAETLHTSPDIFTDGYGAFFSQNVKDDPISFRIVKQLTWDDYNIVVSADPRFVPAAFNYQSGANGGNCDNAELKSTIFPDDPAFDFDAGRNDFFIPNNLVINSGGNLITPTGEFHKVDFEIGTVAFYIPGNTPFDGEKTINILTDFIANYSNHYTRIGYPSMKFADGTCVGMDAFTNNQVRVSIGVLSLSPQINGVDADDISGIIVDERVGVSMDYSTGLLTLQFNNLYEDPVQQTLTTKIQITVYLKKAGWNNTPIVITSNKTKNLLGL